MTRSVVIALMVMVTMIVMSVVANYDGNNDGGIVVAMTKVTPVAVTIVSFGKWPREIGDEALTAAADCCPSTIGSQLG